MLKLAGLKCIFPLYKVRFYEWYFLLRWTLPIIDPIDGDTDFFGSYTRLPRYERGHRECKSERAALAKIERSEAAIVQRCNGEQWSRRVRWTFYVDGNMTKAVTHGWAVGARSSVPSVRSFVCRESPVEWIEAIRTARLLATYPTSLGKNMRRKGRSMRNDKNVPCPFTFRESERSTRNGSLSRFTL